MNCPNCGKEMIRTSNKLTEIVCVMWDQVDGDSEYEPRSGYRYKCTDCNIKHNSLKNHWTIPKNIKPDITYKQQNCISVICKNLNVEIPYIINKKVASEFISKNIDRSKSVNIKNRYYDYYDCDHEDFYGEEFF